MGLIRITPPVEEPVTLAELKDHLKIDHTAEDAKLSALIVAAREYVETATGRAILTQTWETRLEGFPAGPIILRRPPVQAIVSVVYLDRDRAEVVMDPAAYLLDEIEGSVHPNAYPWPATADRFDAVRVRYTCGWPYPEDVPGTIRHVVKLLAAHWYANPEPVALANDREVPMTLARLLNQAKTWRAA